VVLKDGKTAWRKALARRASVLNDVAEYFAALRCCLLNAERTVFIIGWDIHSKARLVGPCGCRKLVKSPEFTP
jgi:phospholipase D1/2